MLEMVAMASFAPRSVAFSVLALILAACSSPAEPGEDVGSSAAGDDQGEPEEGVEASPVVSQNETGDPDAIAPQPLDVTKVSGFIDLRGVGDSAWSNTHQSPPRAAEFDKALADFDSAGTSYKGHVNYINWETVVGNECKKWAAPYAAGRSYAFLSLPESLEQAYDAGFNVVGLSNNHARDCSDDEGEARSSKITVPGIQSIAAGKNWLWHGVSDTEAGEKKISVGTFQAGSRKVKVAFGSAYTGRATCPLAACKTDIDPIMEALKAADVDLRILALHSVGKADQLELARIGVRFVEQFGGDVVYGSGPHVWSRVQVARKPNGKPGVVFESLGNFIHPGLGTQARNIIGRALFDAKTLELAQVQVIPISGAGARMRFATNANLADPALLGNVRFTGAAAIKGGYVNVRAQ